MKHFKVSKYDRVTCIRMPGDVQAIFKEIKTRQRTKSVKDAVAFAAREYAKKERIVVPGQLDSDGTPLIYVPEEDTFYRRPALDLICSKLEEARGSVAARGLSRAQ